jgi:hypothetical protein
VNSRAEACGQLLQPNTFQSPKPFLPFHSSLSMISLYYGVSVVSSKWRVYRTATPYNTCSRIDLFVGILSKIPGLVGSSRVVQYDVNENICL